MNRRGFVLMEVLLAMAFFGLAGVGLARAINMAARAANETRIELSMLNKLQSALTEAHKTAQLEEGSFIVGPDTLGVSIKTEFIPMEELENMDGQLLQDMWLVRCTAFWESTAGEELEMVAETFRYAPLYLPQ
jgi:type II secretory pathway component PulJ